MNEKTISVTFGLWDFGCLPSTLTTKIAEVDRQIAIQSALGNNAAVDNAKLYLGQLQNCLRAVRAASEAPLSADEVERFKAIMGLSQ